MYSVDLRDLGCVPFSADFAGGGYNNLSHDWVCGILYWKHSTYSCTEATKEQLKALVVIEGAP